MNTIPADGLAKTAEYLVNRREGLSAGLGDGRVRLRKASALESPRPGYADGYEEGQRQALAERVEIDRAERAAIDRELIRLEDARKRADALKRSGE